jgi:hypothetical protein
MNTRPAICWVIKFVRHASAWQAGFLCKGIIVDNSHCGQNGCYMQSQMGLKNVVPHGQSLLGMSNDNIAPAGSKMVEMLSRCL